MLKYEEILCSLNCCVGRMRNAREALRLITHELKDIQQAIEFCKEHDDRDLWDDLIAFSLDKPGSILTYKLL